MAPGPKEFCDEGRDWLSSMSSSPRFSRGLVPSREATELPISGSQKAKMSLALVASPGDLVSLPFCAHSASRSCNGGFDYRVKKLGPDLGLVWCRFVLGLPTDNSVISFRLANRNRTDNNFLFFFIFSPHEPSLFPHEPRFFSPRTEIFPHEPRFFPHEPRFFPHEPRFFPTNRDFFPPRSSLRHQGAGGHYRFTIGLANRNR